MGLGSVVAAYRDGLAETKDCVCSSLKSKGRDVEYSNLEEFFYFLGNVSYLPVIIPVAKQVFFEKIR